jgi:hypothetical protein
MTDMDTDNCIVDLTVQIHSRVCGCDDKGCRLLVEIEDWLAEAGMLSRSVDDLVAEWEEK